MARVKYGSIVAEIKGKIGGLVFQKCGNALSVRTNLIHNPPTSIAAKDSRNQFSNIALAWSSLSQSVKSQWAAVASTFPAFDNFGHPMVLNGYQSFIRVNRMLAMHGMPLNLVPSVYDPPTDAGYFSSTLGLSGGLWYFDAPNVLASGVYAAVFVSDPQNSNSLPSSPKKYYYYDITHADPASYNIYADLFPLLPIQPKVGQFLYYETFNFYASTGHSRSASGGLIEVV